MRLAVLGDIHGNLTAFTNVLEHIKEDQVDQIICTGDLVGYGPQPNEVIEAIKGLGIHTVMGNHDDAVGYNLPVCGCAYPNEKARIIGEKSLAWTKSVVKKENRQFLRDLQEELTLSLPGGSALVFHGSPRAINEYIHYDTHEEILEELVEATEAKIFIFGHTHIPFTRSFRDQLFINAGSVGQPKDEDNRSCYLLLDCYPGGVSVRVKRIAYNYLEVKEKILSSGLPWELGEVLLTGRSF